MTIDKSEMNDLKSESKQKIMVFLRRLLLGVLGVLLGVNVYLANASTLAGNRLPMPFGTGIAVVLSGSMEPTLYRDDLIIVRERETYEEDDIVVFQAEGELIVHRIISIKNDLFTTKGDANNVADEPISMEEIRGAVVLRVPMVGRFIQLLRSPIGIVAILVLAFTLVEISFQKEKKDDEERLEAIKDEIRRLKEKQE